ncbi:MAG: CoA transferase [Rhodocyclaceae bacterium]|jgi:alpha-methylacyl-CoA racemase|nr:CoA transferase [Rhodocyclaceae bacterium]MBK6553327.1 CoA transferase [Rhodocyclaceae bacterium]MBK6678485.1 CoA transferase [Rhodocyclaceae bacterium]MBK7812853.1 CoA transferase [Rhodocyclaceae bacterium]MBK9311473.1 CoA transferase [Rhodocyclaceae bacterium]
MALLDGFTVLDLASVGPAARASRILADYGMRVIKVAPVAAKGAKQVDPVFHAYGAGRGTEKIRVDLKSDGGRESIRRLASKVDVVIESYRPGVAERLGVGYEQVKIHNPGIVYCSTSGYGQDGPYAQWVGHDINYLAVGGFLACSGRDGDGLPAIPGATVADSAGGGMHAAIAIVSALLHRARTGEGAYLDVSITDGVLNLMSLYIDQYLATGEETKPKSAVLTGKYAWYGVYAAADGKHLAVGAIENHFFRNLCRLLDLEQFSDSQYDSARQDEMRRAFEERFRSRKRDEWVALLAGNDTCMAPVLDIAEVTVDQHLRTRGAFMRAHHPERGDFEQLSPVLAGGVRAQPLHEVRASGATDTDAVFQAAGFSADEIASLRAAGSVE